MGKGHNQNSSKYSNDTSSSILSIGGNEKVERLEKRYEE